MKKKIILLSIIMLTFFLLTNTFASSNLKVRLPQTNNMRVAGPCPTYGIHRMSLVGYPTTIYYDDSSIAIQSALNWSCPCGSRLFTEYNPSVGQPLGKYCYFGQGRFVAGYQIGCGVYWYKLWPGQQVFSTNNSYLDGYQFN